MEFIEELGSSTTVLMAIQMLQNSRDGTDSFWLQRNENGEFSKLYDHLLLSPEKFHGYMRMSAWTFFYILEKIRPKLRNMQKTNIKPEHRLMLTLRFLSTGLSFRALAFSFRISNQRVGQIIYEVCEAIWTTLRNIHMPFPTVQRFQQTAEEFEALTGFPNVGGCIDGKHVRIKCPNSSGSLFHNYKHYNSIHLQAIGDAKGKFLTIDVGDYGRRADSGVFVESNTFRNIEHNILKFPPARVIDGLELPYVLLGDQGYPLKPYLMRPYSTGDDDDEAVYNCFLSKTRRSIECAFGMMVSKWRCLKTELQVNPDHVDTIVKTTCLLHNICIDFRESQASQWFDPINRENETASLSRRFNHSSQEAYYIRDKFKNYIVRNIVHVTDA